MFSGDFREVLFVFHTMKFVGNNISRNLIGVRKSTQATSNNATSNIDTWKFYFSNSSFFFKFKIPATLWLHAGRLNFLLCHTKMLPLIPTTKNVAGVISRTVYKQSIKVVAKFLFLSSNPTYFTDFCWFEKLFSPCFIKTNLNKCSSQGKKILYAPLRLENIFNKLYACRHVRVVLLGAT